MLTPLVCFGFLSAIYFFYKKYNKISISHIPGPPSSSWLHGNLPELLGGQAGELDSKWQSMYGDIIRVQAAFGEERLLIADPKAIQYIYHTSSYHFLKPRGRTAISHTVFGPGLVNVDGADHKRARKVMLPGFGGPEARSYLPIFFACALKMAEQWKDMIASEASQSVVVNTPAWVSRATMDAIGQAAFEYEFEALDHPEGSLVSAYTNLFFNLFGIPDKASILAVSFMDLLPPSFNRWLLKTFAPRRIRGALNLREKSTAVARDLVNAKSSELLEGKTRRDIMSLLVKANKSQDPNSKLTDDELYAQMNTIMLAGHETTANSLSWTLYELCKNPAMQTRLREEIRAFGKAPTDFTDADFDSLPYLTAVVKESLRFHPVIIHSFRVASRDDVLPLLKPITTMTGEVLSELPIAKGTFVMTSFTAYNRYKDIFGQDAHVFNPDRWLREDAPKSSVPLGTYASLFTFSGGARSCIGWRFAVLELQAFIVALVSQFEFEFGGVKAEDIRREACAVMIPTLKQEVNKGSQLPLRVKVAA